MQYESENPLSGVTLGFFAENLDEVSDEHGERLWKSGTKASGPQVHVCWQTIAGH